jgi:hypothetical protein
MRRLPIDANRPLAGIIVLDFGQVPFAPMTVRPYTTSVEA